jgi:hypothetical protein
VPSLRASRDRGDADPGVCAFRGSEQLWGILADYDLSNAAVAAGLAVARPLIARRGLRPRCTSPPGLYFTSQRAGGRVDIMRLSLTDWRISTLVADAGAANGMTLDRDGRLVVC